MVRRLLLLATLLLCWQTYAYGNDSARGWCEAGATIVITSGLNSTTLTQGSYPQCTISVFTHGAGLATIYSDNNNTPLANPFTAQTNGQWSFYAAQSRVDITMSGGGLTSPVTYSDVLLADPAQDATTQCVLAPSTTPALNAGLCSIFSMTLTAAAAASISGGIPGQSITVSLTQGSGGPWAFTWPSSFVNPPTFTQVAGASAQFRFVLLADGLWHHSGTGESQVFNTAQNGNQLFINGVAVSGVTGTGPNAVLQNGPTINGGALTGTFSGNPTLSGNLTIGGTLAANGPAIFKGPAPWIDPRAYGAACNGSGDDSAALQAAGNASISQGAIVMLPPGARCNYATTLTFTGVVAIAGTRSAGTAFSELRYTGTGNGIVVNSGGPILYNVDFENFQIIATQSAATAIQCVGCYQLIINNVGVFGGQTYPTVGWTTGFDLTGDSGITVNNPACVDTATCFKLSGTSQFNSNAGQFFQNTRVFLAGGNSTGIVIHDIQNAEAQDYFILADDSLVTPPAILSSISVHDNSVLFDGGAATYPHQRMLQVNNSSTNEIYMKAVDFTNNKIFCPATVCSGAYAFDFNISASASLANVFATIEKNFISAFSTAAVTANSSNVNVALINNQNLQANGVTPATDTSGTGNYALLNYPLGVFTFPNPIVTNGLTDNVGITPAALTMNSDTTHNNPRMFLTCNVATTSGSSGISWCAIEALDKPITILRIGLVANGQALTCSTQPTYGILTTSAFATLPNSTTFVDSGALAVNLAAGTYTIGQLVADAGCGTQPTNVNISIMYKMQ